MMILSMDLGKFNTACCLYGTENRKYRFETIATTRPHLDHLLDTHPADLIVMEACGPSGWISDVCKQRGLNTIVCSTNDDAWSWKNTKRKTDRNDALKLAKMAVFDALTPVHIPKPEVRQQRMLIKYRKKLDGRITQIKNAIRALFVNQGIEIDTGKLGVSVGNESTRSASRSKNAATLNCGRVNSIWNFRSSTTCPRRWKQSRRSLRPMPKTISRSNE